MGLLIEVPVLLALVHVSLWLRPRLFPPPAEAVASEHAPGERHAPPKTLVHS